MFSSKEMAASENHSVAALRTLKREDHKRTKHNTHFSKWQVLIGPCDWKDYDEGKEGAARYRVHNLPTKSGPGLYELGIFVDPDNIVVVYLGQADNVRSRLQHYGRSGSHLGNTNIYATIPFNQTQTRPGFFDDIFLRGHSIVFRWASMNDKKHAEKTEAKLLDTYDYGWNKGSNGARRPDDILQKLDNIASSTIRFSNISKRLLYMRPSGVGVDIKSNKPSSSEKSPADEDTKHFLLGIFKFNRSQPRLVSDKRGTDEDFSQVCGFIMSDAIPCRRPPVPGIKRCEEHKGMRIYLSNPKPITEWNSRPYVPDVQMGIYLSNPKPIAEGNSRPYAPDVQMDSSCHNDQDLKATCRINLGDGFFCKRRAIPGRKRREEHKGMKINSNSCVPKSIAEEKCHFPGNCTNNNNASSSYESCIHERIFTICGATLGNGSVCSRQPVAGNKRCWQHKGKRADTTNSSSSSRFGTLKCGVALQNGSICMRSPVQGRKRCEQHKGMRVPTF